MAENTHYKELLQLLNEFEVEYLIVGGFAVMKYSESAFNGLCSMRLSLKKGNNEAGSR